MIRILDVPLDDDLSQFSRLLWQKKISHRTHLIDNRQILTVTDNEAAIHASKLYQQWLNGEIAPVDSDSSDFITYIKPGEYIRNLVAAFFKAPLSLTLVVLCTLLLFIAPLNEMTDLVRNMLYPDFSFGTRIIDIERVMASFGFLTLLKMISPILLHGGLLHLAFNMLWLWEFGRRIEAVQASWAMFILVVVIALISNTVQFLYGGSIFFGGMSGVVYGLFGYIWMWQLFDHKKNLALPKALVFFLILSLVILTLIDLEMIADEAHIGGLVAGMIYGGLTANVSRILRSARAKKEH